MRRSSVLPRATSSIAFFTTLWCHFISHDDALSLSDHRRTAMFSVNTNKLPQAEIEACCWCDILETGLSYGALMFDTIHSRWLCLLSTSKSVNTAKMCKGVMPKVMLIQCWCQKWDTELSLILRNNNHTHLLILIEKMRLLQLLRCFRNQHSSHYLTFMHSITNRSCKKTYQINWIMNHEATMKLPWSYYLICNLCRQYAVSRLNNCISHGWLSVCVLILAHTWWESCTSLQDPAQHEDVLVVRLLSCTLIIYCLLQTWPMVTRRIALYYL